MTNSIDIKCDCMSGRSLDELSKLIKKRSDALGETTKDAVISTAINVLVSLRSGTNDAKKSRRDRKCKAVEMPGLRPGFSSDHRWCIRTSGGARFSARRVKFLTDRLTKDLKVYKIIPVHTKVGEYYVVAANIDRAVQFEEQAAKHRIENYGTLAKWALGVAMNKLSTRNVQDGVSSLARNAGSRLANVISSGSAGPSGNFNVTVDDSLDYAFSAMKHGAAELDMAMRKASNKTAGIINHHLHKIGEFGSDVDTPFPEIKRR